ncbi:flagellar assembly protein FliW [Campylobacterota bacterium DY0563]|uniref:flagellar assembly protein FliW n=1 Tax=Halarcobacter sp. TaxID=2321133 RepID=UPI0029F46994|nr:flagellar assembly protein FliW [Halarcobacter sp.]
MVFEVVVPIDGCEEETEFELMKLDDFFSVITGVETGVTLRLMSFGALKSLAFEFPDDFKEKLDIQNLEELSIFYIFVLQSQVSESSMNIFSPIIINNRSLKMGQIHLNLEELGLESLNNILPKF